MTNILFFGESRPCAQICCSASLNKKKAKQLQQDTTSAIIYSDGQGFLQAFRKSTAAYASTLFKVLFTSILSK